MKRSPLFSSDTCSTAVLFYVGSERTVTFWLQMWSVMQTRIQMSSSSLHLIPSFLSFSAFFTFSDFENVPPQNSPAFPLAKECFTNIQKVLSRFVSPPIFILPFLQAVQGGVPFLLSSEHPWEVDEAERL